jgi:hypothetical protein
MDLINLKDELKIVSEVTLPQLLAIGRQIVADLDKIVDRLDGARIEIIIHLKESKNETQNLAGVVTDLVWRIDATGTKPGA